ncbi:MAG: TonB family protein [Candidatus Aminicenantes bacterium]|nr:TonB family protein [Candidatus Aminicenantes bacterium]NIM80087.1 TonB family protein [Candidatus Aminicenantes bacterium]NIN19429.1 TonB family protein [Candidatus Aminicenantes bacterium]NIN43328.1 TonB family protein [Candidatus Aminicenantes bacterium]NIN86072.1 TonB family protein [Candidatus Aminicenantes bacterium]
MNIKYFKYAGIIIAILLLLWQPVTAGEKEEGDILVHLRLYEGSRGNEMQKSSVVSSYYLKPLFVSSLVSEMDIRQEQKELKRIFNLSDIKLMTKTQWGWKYGKSEKRFRMVVLNGHEFLVQLTMKGKKNGFKVEVVDKGEKAPRPLLETELELPQKKSTVFGFEDSLRKPYFICLQREENQSIIDKEPIPVSPDKPRLMKRAKPLYPKYALARKIQGEVILDAATDIEGNVAELYVVDGVKELTVAAIEAVKQWKYEPYIKDGKAVPIRFTVIIHFDLPGEAGEKLKYYRKSPRYTGELMDFHFVNADIKNVLRIIAKIVEINIVVDPGIAASVSCQMSQVPWDQALESILLLNGLDMIRKGNVLRIMKATPDNKRLKQAVARKEYTGEPCVFDFKNVDIKDVLDVIAAVGKFKIKVEPSVGGRVTCKMRKVPWDQFLDLILQINELDMKWEGEGEKKVLKIFKPEKKLEKITKEKKAADIPNILPVKGYLADGFGFRKDAKTNKKTFHNGIDIAAKKGTEVIAPADGTVIAAESRKKYGKLLIIDHGNGYTTWYGELSRFNVKKGEKVKRGQVIGYVGNSGSKGESHLHYEVRLKDKPINPLSLVREK